jgi:hypothetical protein
MGSGNYGCGFWGGVLICASQLGICMVEVLFMCLLKRVVSFGEVHLNVVS